MTLQEARNNVYILKMATSNKEEIIFYNREFQRHHIGSLFGFPLEKHTPIASILIHSFDLDKKIEIDDLAEEKFESYKMKIIMFMDDLLSFLSDNNLEDKSMEAIFPKF